MREKLFKSVSLKNHCTITACLFKSVSLKNHCTITACLFKSCSKVVQKLFKSVNAISITFFFGFEYLQNLQHQLTNSTLQLNSPTHQLNSPTHQLNSPTQLTNSSTHQLKRDELTVWDGTGVLSSPKAMHRLQREQLSS